MPTPQPATPLHYRIEPADLHAHLFHVTLTIAQPAAQQRVALPVWIPVSYLVREFAKNLQNLRATQSRRSVPVHQLDKATWQLSCLPNIPQYCRATPTECLPFFGNPVSSMIHQPPRR